MTEKHEMSWDPDVREFVDENNWIVRERTGTTTVQCSCGLVEDVADKDVQRAVEEHRATAGTST